MITTTIKFRFDGRSTANQVIKVTVINPLTTVTLTYLFSQDAVEQATLNTVVI